MIGNDFMAQHQGPSVILSQVFSVKYPDARGVHHSLRDQKYREFKSIDTRCLMDRILLGNYSVSYSQHP